CGCHDYFECKLIDFANQYNVHPERFAGEKNTIDFNDDHPFIVRDPNKCILCGLCVRVCDEVMGVGALGLVNRGFDTVVKPNMEKPLIESGCISCGQCVSVCPTGALQERTSLVKEVPVDTEHTLTTCSMCSVGCTLDLETRGDMLVKANPYKEGLVNKGLACGKGKWGFDSAILEGKVEECLIKEGNDWREADYHEALMLIAKKCQIAAQRHGRDAVAVAVSDRYTNEEAYAIKVMADAIGAKLLCLNNRQSGLKEVLGVEGSPNTIDELLSTNLILKVGFEPADSRVIDIKIKQAAERGAKVLDLGEAGDDLSFLKELAKALIEQGKGEKLAGYEELKNSLENVVVSEKAQILCEQYLSAKKAMIVYQVNNLTVDGAKLVGDIALLSGHIGKPRDGILAVLPKNNSQGLHDLGITAGAEALEGVKALVVFGENVPIDTDKLEFLAVCDTHMTDLGDKACVFIPGTGFASTNGTFTNTERRLQAVEAAVDEGIFLSNWEVASEIAHIFEVETPWEDTDDISDEMCDTEPLYKYSIMDEVRGGVLAPVDPKLVAVGDGALVDPLDTTDSLMQSINERIPKPVCPTI
ncbi:MAG: molybdopterin-dependent oxidoreductase, partial [Firmicutes bacterium]|nr:molybdopterin-dependent oxidoreductase [Bacillota bacterium]